MKSYIGLCETQPATAAGVLAYLGETDDMDCRWTAASLDEGIRLARQLTVEVLVIDASFGHRAISAAIADLQWLNPKVAILVWGGTFTRPEVFKLVEAGAAGLLTKTASMFEFVDCLRKLRTGGFWLDGFTAESEVVDESRFRLTARERQVFDLVDRGLKNGEIAAALGIAPGTVKIHIRSICQKKRVNGRLGLAIRSLPRFS